MAAPALATCNLVFRNNSLQRIPAAYEPGDTVELEVRFEADGAEVEVSELFAYVLPQEGVEVDVASSLVADGSVDGLYSLSYYLEAGRGSDTGVATPGAYVVYVRGKTADDTVVAGSGFFIVTANEVVSPESDISSLHAACLVELGSMLSVRTYDDFGNELGRFTMDTRPNEYQARQIVNTAHSFVSLYIGYNLSDTSVFTSDVLELIQSVITLKAACLIELDFFPEQVRSEKSAYKEYNAMFDLQLAQLVKSLKDLQAGGEIGASDDSGFARYAFPEDTGGLVGWQSQW